MGRREGRGKGKKKGKEKKKKTLFCARVYSLPSLYERQERERKEGGGKKKKRKGRRCSYTCFSRAHRRKKGPRGNVIRKKKKRKKREKGKVYLNNHTHLFVLPVDIFHLLFYIGGEPFRRSRSAINPRKEGKEEGGGEKKKKIVDLASRCNHSASS